MITNSFLVIVCAALLLAGGGFAADAIDPHRLQKEGEALTEADVAKLESKIAGKFKSKDKEDRIRLLHFYAHHSNDPDSARWKKGRNEVVLSIIEKGSMAYTGSWCRLLVYPSIGSYADSTAAASATAAWSQRAASEPDNVMVTQRLAAQMALTQPEEAFRLLAKSGIPHETGEQAAKLLLGITLYNLTNCQPTGVSARKPSESVRLALLALDKSPTGLFVGYFASTLAALGEELHRKNLIDWDYTLMANHFRECAIVLLPEEKENFDLEYKLPSAEGKAKESQVQSAKLVSQAVPKYPARAKANRVEGQVTLQAVIGASGKVIWLGMIEGPSEFLPSALAAVRQWVYSPTRIDGRAVIILTTISVNYSFR